MGYAKTEYINKCEKLPEGEHLYALLDETYTTGDRDEGYSTTQMVQIIFLGGRENALLWIREQEERSRAAHYYPKTYKIVSMKTLAVQRTVNLDIK